MKCLCLMWKMNAKENLCICMFNKCILNDAIVVAYDMMFVW